MDELLGRNHVKVIVQVSCLLQILDFLEGLNSDVHLFVRNGGVVNVVINQLKTSSFVSLKLVSMPSFSLTSFQLISHELSVL